MENIDKLEWTKKQKLFELLSLLLLIGIVAQIFISYPNLPEKIPSNFDFEGNIRSYDSKNVLFIMPVVMIGMYALMTAVSFYPKTWNKPMFLYKEENYKDVLMCEKDLLCSIKFFTLLLFAVMINDMIMCRSLSLVPFIGSMALIFADGIYYIVKMYRVGKK